MEKQSRLKVIDRDVIKYIIVFFMATGHLIAWIATGYDKPDGLFEQCPFWQRIFIELSLIQVAPLCGKLSVRRKKRHESRRK